MLFPRRAQGICNAKSIRGCHNAEVSKNRMLTQMRIILLYRVDLALNQSQHVQRFAKQSSKPSVGSTSSPRNVVPNLRCCISTPRGPGAVAGGEIWGILHGVMANSLEVFSPTSHVFGACARTFTKTRNRFENTSRCFSSMLILGAFFI